jgi:hypothetical protein
MTEPFGYRYPRFAIKVSSYSFFKGVFSPNLFIDELVRLYSLNGEVDEVFRLYQIWLKYQITPLPLQFLSSEIFILFIGRSSILFTPRIKEIAGNPFNCWKYHNHPNCQALLNKFLDKTSAFPPPFLFPHSMLISKTIHK